MREYAFCGSLADIETIDFDVIIVGAGAAGLYAALNIDPKLSCAVLDKLGIEESNSMYAQGGIASVTLKEDSWQSHYEDTLIAGAGLCDKEAVKVLVNEGPKEIQKLMGYGVPFDRDENNNLYISMEGAHTYKRILHCGGDATGLHMTKTLTEAVKKLKNVTRMDNIMLLDILTDENNSVTGAIVQDKTGKNSLLRSSYIITASGGIGRVYRNSTNSSIATGDGIAAAIRAGAKVDNMEFVQFHPTALIHPDLNMRYFLISEALRGEGAILRNRRWEPFMQEVHPMADLAPRDIVSRAIVSEMRKYDLPNVYLDITSKSREFLIKRFPVIYNECMNRGIDIAVDWIPVVPVQHYFMGGIKTDTNGRTNIEGLYACGECACTGVHGANRLASNSLLECLVFGHRCAANINEVFTKDKKASKLLFDNSKPKGEIVDIDTCRSQIRKDMTKKGGIIRNKTGLTETIAEIGEYYENLNNVELNEAREIETLNMATVSLHILNAALKREKSIGAHFRSDEIK